MRGFVSYRDLTDALVCSSLGQSGLTKRDTSVLMAAGDSCSVSDLYRFVETGRGARVLRSGFNTPERRARLQNALHEFERVTLWWLVGNRRNGRYSWLVPDTLAEAVLLGEMTRDDFLSELSLLVRDFETAIENDLRMVRHLERLSTSDLWLPFLSVEGARELRRLRDGDAPRLVAAMARGIQRSGHYSTPRPWRDGIPAELACLPVWWLFQFDPDRRTATLLSRLSRSGYSNVGHLSILDPDARTFVRTVEDRRLIRLAIGLNGGT